MEDRTEEVLHLVMPAESQRNADPTADERENREDCERNPHNCGRLMHAMRMGCLSAVMLGLSDHGRVRVAVRVNRREVLIVITMRCVAMGQRGLIEARSAEEGLEPQPEHIKARDAGSYQADEPERVA